MEKVIRTYETKYGPVTVTRYDDESCLSLKPDFHVELKGLPGVHSYWSKDKVDAIKYAQFLAGWADNQTYEMAVQ